MDAVTPKHATVVRPANMEWQQTRFPGCEVKTLLFDAQSGLVTVLTRFAPGAVLPDHEHVKIEQTYVLEGRLVDKEGPDAGRITDFRHGVIRACGPAARYSLNTRPHTLSQSSPLASVTRPSRSKNLLGSWNIASITPPSGA